MSEIKQAEVSQAELLRYHQTLTDRIDEEVALKDANKALAALKKPPVQPVHPHAAISHAAQQLPENENNKKAAAGAKAKTGKNDLDRQISEVDAQKDTASMRQQIEAAASRKTDNGPIAPWQPSVVTETASTTAAPAAGTEVTPAKSAAPPVPSWK